ncbi:MAG TPA: NAD-dependent epimerase/dehydratase family protein [Noviherbaspirillum sp.]|uniref:NAD-dependent epimerase/dehydratase family protein n=1 Tax=Noviherbaspirillum sp. TaxID=1926288 RepID=UPI002DDD7E50|nr:NAD-dependent epimerase/dehydratase family protein [Noviherbaspirillum sp.]HEV2612611.1 NAD-dependent epimerase/dehydratase family protein [Noviherbaspirillum sp.]
MTTQGNALILGATGGIGGELARQLSQRGWRINALHRAAASQRARDPRFNWIQGDAMNPSDVIRAAEGASLIVHAVNPPGYRDWDKLVLPMIDNTIAAARQSGARIVLPGTIYNYGPDAFPVITESSPQNPFTRKGAIRKEMERRLASAAEAGVRSLIVRAGDFFGPQAGNNWFSQGLVKPGKPVTAIMNPGARGIGHQWAYLPDVAETICRLVAMDASLDAFAMFHMKGHRDEDGTRMVDAIRRIAEEETGSSAVRIRAMPWWALMAISPFVPTLREMKEMRYLWQQPVFLDNRKLLGVLGEEPHTPLEDAVRATLTGLRCIGTAAIGDGVTVTAE